MRRHRRLVQAAVTPRREDMRQPGNCATERGTLGRRHRRQGSAAALRVTEHVLLREKARLVRGVHWSPASRAHAGRTVPPLVTGPADRRDPALECAPRLALRNAYEAHGARHFASPKHGVPSARRPACRSWWRARACCSSPSPSSCGGPANGNPPRHPRLRARGRRRDGGIPSPNVVIAVIEIMANPRTLEPVQAPGDFASAQALARRPPPMGAPRAAIRRCRA